MQQNMRSCSKVHLRPREHQMLLARSERMPSGSLWDIRVACAPDIVGQQRVHAAAQVRRQVGVGKRRRLAWADECSVQWPAIVVSA